MAQKKETSKFGKTAENFAAGYLSSEGYKIIDRNFRSKFGEIDLIAIKDNKLILIEVKARTSDKFGLPEEAVTPSKIWKIARTAEYYSLLNPKLPKSLRIEVVSIQIADGKLNKCIIIPVD